MDTIKKASKGIAWVSLTISIVGFSDLIVKLILARLLLPSDFGLIAIGLLAVNTGMLFGGLGFRSALIYKKDDEEFKSANTAFIILPVIGALFFLIIYSSAPYIATYFKDPSIEPIVKVLAFILIISPLAAVPSTLLEKELEFKKKVLPGALPTLLYAVVAISMALKGYGVWSLVGGQISMAALRVILNWMVCGWRPTFKFDMMIGKELFSYGKHIVGASAVIFLVVNAATFAVGKVLGVTALGFYSIAFAISNMPATYLNRLIGGVMFPTYSKLQDDSDTIRSIYLSTLRYISILTIPMAIGTIITAPYLVEVVLGEKWMSSVPAIRILVFVSVFRTSVSGPSSDLLKSVGKPNLVFKLNLIRLAIMLILLNIMIGWGIVGVSIAVVITSFISSTLILYVVKDLLKIETRTFIKVFTPMVESSLLMFLTLLILREWVFRVIQLSDAVSLAILVIVGAISYFGFMMITGRETLIGYKNLLYSIFIEK